MPHPLIICFGQRCSRPIGSPWRATLLSLAVAAQQHCVCSCFGTAHFDLRRAQRALHFCHRVGVHFINADFWKPGEPQSENACGFLLCTGLRYPGQPPQLLPCSDDPKANQSAEPIRMMATMYGNACACSDNITTRDLFKPWPHGYYPTTPGGLGNPRLALIVRRWRLRCAMIRNGRVESNSNLRRVRQAGDLPRYTSSVPRKEPAPQI